MKYVELGTIFLLLVLFVLAVGFSLYGLFMWAFVHNKLRAERKADEAAKARKRSKDLQKGQMGTLYAIGAAVVAVVIGLLLVLGSGAQVEYGHVGVVSEWGSIDQNQQPLSPGFHMVMPFATHIESVSVQQQNHTFKEVSTASKELQNVYVDGGINYHITPSEATGITINGGEDAYVQRVFNPAFQDYIKEVVPQYATVDILSHRAEIRDKVLQKLRDKADDPSLSYHVKVDDLFITDIHFDKGYTAAIESAAESQQNLAKAKIDAQTKVAQAQGDADAQVARAKADRDSNALRQQSLTPELIQYLQVQNQQAAIAKWNGVLPTTEVGGGSSLIIGFNK